MGMDSVYRDSILVEDIDETGHHYLRDGQWITEPLTDDEARDVALWRATDAAETARAEAFTTHRDALAIAREILLGYHYGAPGTPTFPEVLSPVQTAVLAYRDSGITDPECDSHIMWINARVNEINATALYAAKVLK